MKFVSKEAQNSNIVTAILNSTQQPSHVISSERFCSSGFRNYHTGLWLLLSHVIWSQISLKLRNVSSEDSEVNNHVEKIDFAGLVKDAKSVAGFSPFHRFPFGRSDVT